MYRRMMKESFSGIQNLATYELFFSGSLLVLFLYSQKLWPFAAAAVKAIPPSSPLGIDVIE